MAGSPEASQALRSSGEALALAGKLGEAQLRAVALQRRAQVLGHVGRARRGLQLVREAVEICGRLRDQAGWERPLRSP